MEEYLKLNIGKGNIIILREPKTEEEVYLYFIGKCKEFENSIEVYGKHLIDNSMILTQKMLILQHKYLIKDENFRVHFEKSVNNYFDNWIEDKL